MARGEEEAAAEEAGAVRALGAPREDAPEAKRLVSRPRHDRLAVWAAREVQDAVGVAREGGHLGHGGVRPDDDLVQGVPVRADDLVHVLGPQEVADLRARVDGADGGARLRVPEADAAVRRAAARGQEPALVRRPGDGLDGRRVVREALDGAVAVLREAPDEELVVVAARGQLGVIEGPAQAAHLLPVGLQARNGGGGRRRRRMIPHAQVPQENQAVAAPRCQDLSNQRLGGARPSV